MDQGFKEVAAERHFWEEDTAQHLITQNDGSEPSLLASWCMYKKGLSNSQFPQQKRGDSLQEYRWGGGGVKNNQRGSGGRAPRVPQKDSSQQAPGLSLGLHTPPNLPAAHSPNPPSSFL